ncbi:MAG: phosphotransferase [Bdellovibrio sp.]
MNHLRVQRQNSSFFNFTPELLLQATEAAGFSPTGEFRQLNSYENRVFDLGLESKERIICKVYRPLRWPRACIQEEHDFLWELQGQGFPCVAPLRLQSSYLGRRNSTSSDIQMGTPEGIPVGDQKALLIYQV